MRFFAICLVLTAAAARASQPAATTSPSSGASVAEITAVEKAFDASIRGYSIDAPFDQLLPTHGIPVEGYGLVFVTDVNLVSLPPLFGFGGRIEKSEIARIHESKLKRLPAVRQLMTQMLLAASGMLSHLSPDENILLQFNFYSQQFEDRTGLATSMSIQGKKKDLMDAAAKKLPAESVSGILKVRVE